MGMIRTSNQQRKIMGRGGAWQGPSVPAGGPASIVGAAAFHDRVRDGNGWDDRASTTRKPLVGAPRFELGTSWSQTTRAEPNCATPRFAKLYSTSSPYVKSAGRAGQCRMIPRGRE